MLCGWEQKRKKAEKERWKERWKDRQRKTGRERKVERQAEKDRQRKKGGKKGGKTGRERKAEKGQAEKDRWKERWQDRQRKAVLVHSTTKYTCTTTYPLENSNNGAGQHKVTKRSLLLEANNANNGPTTVVLPAPMTWQVLEVLEG